MNWHYTGPRFQFAAELALFSACVRSVVDDSLNCPFNCSLQDSWRGCISWCFKVWKKVFFFRTNPSNMSSRVTCRCYWHGLLFSCVCLYFIQFFLVESKQKSKCIYVKWQGWHLSQLLLSKKKEMVFFIMSHWWVHWTMIYKNSHIFKFRKCLFLKGFYNFLYFYFACIMLLCILYDSSFLDNTVTCETTKFLVGASNIQYVFEDLIVCYECPSEIVRERKMQSS